MGRDIKRIIELEAEVRRLKEELELYREHPSIMEDVKDFVPIPYAVVDREEETGENK